MRVHIFLLCILALGCVHCEHQGDGLFELEEILSHLEFNERGQTESKSSDSDSKPKPTGTADSSESKPEPTGPEPTGPEPTGPEPTGPEPTDQPDLQMRTAGQMELRIEPIVSLMKGSKSHVQRNPPSKMSRPPKTTTAAPNVKRSDRDLQLRTVPQLEQRIEEILLHMQRSNSHVQRSKTSKSPKRPKGRTTTATPVKRSDRDMELRTVLLREFNLRKNKRAKSKPKTTTAAPVKRSDRDELREIVNFLSNLEFNERSKPETAEPAQQMELRTAEPAQQMELRTAEPAQQMELRTAEPAQQMELRTAELAQQMELRTAEPAQQAQQMKLRTAEILSHMQRSKTSKSPKQSKSKTTTAAPVKRSDRDMELRTVLLREFNLRKNKRAKSKPKTTAAPNAKRSDRDELREIVEILSNMEFNERTEPKPTGSVSDAKSGPEPTEPASSESSSESESSESKPKPTGPEPTDSSDRDLELRRIEEILSHLEFNERGDSKPKPTGSVSDTKSGPEPTGPTSSESSSSESDSKPEPTGPEPTDPSDRDLELRRIEEILSHLEFNERGDSKPKPTGSVSDTKSGPEPTGPTSSESSSSESESKPEPTGPEPTDSKPEPTGVQREEAEDWSQWRMMDLKSRVNKRERRQQTESTETESTETESTETEETGSGEIELTTPTFLRKEEAVNFLKITGGKHQNKAKNGRRETALLEEKTDILSILKRRMMDVQARGMGGQGTRGGYKGRKRQITTPATLDGTNTCLMPDPEMERLRQLVREKIEEIIPPPTTPNTATTAPEIPAQLLANAVLIASDELLELMKGVSAIPQLKVCANTVQSIGLMVNTVEDHIIPNIKETIFNIFSQLYLDGKISPDMASKAKENLDEFMKVLYGPVFKAVRRVNDLVEKKYSLDVEDIRNTFKMQEKAFMTTPLPETPTDAVERIVLPLIDIFKTLIEKVPMEERGNRTFCRDQIHVLIGNMQKVFMKISQDKEMMKETLEEVLDLDTKTITELETLINSEKERKILQSPFETLHLILEKMLDAAETGYPLLGPHLDLTTFFMKKRLKKSKQNMIVHEIKTKIAEELMKAASTVTLDTELSELTTFDSIPMLWSTVWYTISSEVGLGINRGECTKPELVATAGIVKLSLKTLSVSHMWNLECAIERLPPHAVQLKMKVRDIVKEQLKKFVTETVGTTLKGLMMEINAGDKAFNPAELIYLKLAVLSDKSEPIITFGDLLEKALRIIVSTFDRVQKNLVRAGKDPATFLEPVDPLVIQQKFKMLKQSLNPTGTTLDPLIIAINNAADAEIPAESRSCPEVIALKLEIETGVKALFNKVHEMLMYDLVEILEDGTVDVPTACRAKDLITGTLGYVMNDQLEIIKTKRRLAILSEW